MTEWVLRSAGSLSPVEDLAAARSAVEQAAPGSAASAGTRAQILAFLDDHPDALHRSCLSGHLTGSALVVDPSSQRILLLFHAKVRRWLQPGGHADGDGNLAHVALREAWEETGIEGLQVVTPAIDLDVHVFHNSAKAEPDHLHLDVRHLVLAPPGATTRANHESEGMAWVTEGELPSYDVDAGTLRMARAGLEALSELPALGY